MSGKNLIFVSRATGDSYSGSPHIQEALGAVALTPGYLVSLNAGGEFALAAAGTTALTFIVNLNTLKQGDTTTTFAEGDTVQGILPRDGERFNVRCAASQALVKGSPLKVAAGGVLTLATLPADADSVKFYADEVVATTTANQLVRVTKA